MIHLAKAVAARMGRLEPRGRVVALGALAVLGMTGVSAMLAWMSAEAGRLSVLEQKSSERLAAMQERVVEFNNLKTRTLPVALSGASLSDAITSSLQSHQLSLTVHGLDAQRLQVRGEANFDRAMHWIGSIQQSHRVSLVSLAAVNRGNAASLDMVLTSAPE